MTNKPTKGKVKKGDEVYCIKSLPFGRSGKRAVLGVADGHSIYVRLTKKDNAYQNREPDQGYWQVMWNEFRKEFRLK